MAERPLYTLYKNLKAQNYDVPDDYNKFESALTRDGKGGADNRHAIYENLKAQNFDVPNTYERFYSALFEPRSKTSSRAKGGSVPMSAADRARFSAGAAAISASAQHTMNNAGRYNRLKQRKQKQQKDFGRVNLGTHQTPYGGDANNVVKDDFAYNPETGKAGAYVSSDNENVYSQPEAEQKQAVLDQQNNAYQEAVDTGEIPSVFDVRDKNGNYDLQENINKNGTYLTEEGARNQFDKKLADAYARKKEIEALIAEDHRQHGNPLLSYGASIGASNGRTAEQSDYSNKLATSLALVKQQIGALEAVKQYPTSSWGEDALKALDNTVFTAKTWDFGLTDFATMGQMERIKTKMDNNLPLSGSDKMLLKSKLGADAVAALEDEKMGNIYRWTKIAGQSLPFMADFFLTGGYGGITKAISRGALKFAAKRGMGKVGAAILKNTGIVAGDVIGSYAMAGSEQAMKTGADIMQRHLGNLYQDEKGDYKFGTFDENGNLLHDGGESMGTALYKGLTSAMVENYTEKLFGHSYGIKKGAINFMEKHGMNASAEFFKNIGKSGWYTNSKKWMEKFGINGFGEEVMEEEIGIPLHALLDGDNKFSDLLDTKQQLDIIGGMALSVGSMYAMGAGSRPVKGVYNRSQYYRFRNKVNVADSDAQNLMGDKWADIKDKIDNTTNEQMGGVLADILRQRDTMSKDQINAAINYGINLMKMRGYNVAKTAEMNAREITNEPTTPEEQHQEDIDNAYSEGHDADDADKHDIQLEHEDQMKTLAGLLNISEQQLSAMNDDELQSLTGQNDKIDQAIYDYQLSSARYQGVTDDAQDKIDMAANQAAQRVDMYTDKSRGSVRNATVKASGGAEDYGVYIISGNIAINEDGSINVADSDDMILFYDPTTNSVEHADALRFAELGDEVPADDVKAQAVADAKEKAIKEVAGIVDGTIDVGSQFKVTGADGLEHTYEILADYGDGTAAISIDGNVVENPYSLEDLQQLKDLEDQKRLEAAKAQREQMEKERAEQQTQETEQPEETQPSLDFNQILNDNGNVVLADVLGKDGNTKYPNSQLFLIRDSGAKAKVMELKSDGTLVPHAVNKKDVRTATTMTLDEYKQAFADSSMIEDNSGAIEGGRGGIEVNDELPPVPDNVTINGDGTYSVDGAVQGGENTTAPAEQTEQTPAMTLEDGTIVPMLEDGNPDFSKLTADQTAELYDSQFGEDADSVISGWVSDAKKALDKANNMTVKGKNFVEQKAAKEAKEKAIADAQAAYDSAIAIRDAYNSRQLAKVEDDADGRKNLIEKARRKFSRLKSAVKDDAEAVSQLYKDVVGSLLHRLYDGTGIDVTDTIPLTAEEYVASNLGAHSLNYEGTETSKGVKQETGLSREDFAKTQLLAADGKGTTIDDLVHSLWENRPSNLESLDTQDIRNALIGVLNSGFKASEARNYIENLRIAQAENILEEQNKAADNAAFAEENKAESEQQTETAPESEEKTGEDNSDEINDEENEQTNAPEVPEDATDENPLGAQRDQTDLPFSARDNGTQQTTSERAADVEKNKVDDMKVVDNIVGEKTRKAFERLAKMMGANIQWQYSDKLGNGWIQEAKDADGNVHRTIFITLDSSITEGAQFIFGHEMTHQIKSLNPAAYNELTKLVLDTYGSDAFDKAIDETMKRYSDAGFSGRARDYYAEEVVADAVGEMIRDLNLAHTLAMKMSHPLLAAIHEILQKIKIAFYGTEYSDVTKNIIRSIEQAYVRTANGQVTNSETGEDVSFSLRQKPEPKKKGIGYKVFVLKDGKLYPPMVANPNGAATPVGVWLDADAAPIAGESKTGRPQVKQGGKGTQGGSGKLAYRPGWHLGVVPYAIQFNRKDAEGNKTLFPKNFVFAEVEYAADVDYQEEARQEGINPSGKYQHSLAGLKHLPTDGYYMYRTNPNPETDPWVITGAMKVNRILTRAEQAELVKNAGREPQQIQEGDIVTDDVVNSINQEIADAPKFSLKSKPVRFEAGKKLSDEEKKEVLSTLKDAYKVNGVPYHIEETAGGKEKRVYEPTADSYVVSDITNRPLRYYITLPDGRVAHPTEVYPNISDNEVKSSATKQGLLDEEVDQIVSAAIGNMKDIADNAKAIEVLTELQNLPHETHDVGYGLNHARSYNYKTGIFTSDAAQAIDYVVRRMRRKEDVPAEIPAALKKAVADSYGMVDNLIDGMSTTKFSLKKDGMRSLLDVDGKPVVVREENGNVDLNYRTWQDEKELVRDALVTDAGLEEDEADAMIAQADVVADAMKSYMDKYPRFRDYQYAPAGNREIIRDNGDYLSWDYSFNCIKKDAMNAVMDKLVSLGKSSHLGVTQVEAIKKILQKHKFLTPCVMCYVEGKRKVLKQSKADAQKWNSVREYAGLENKEMGEPTELTDEQQTALKNLSNGKAHIDGIDDYSVQKIANLMLDNDILRGNLNYEWMMSPSSFTQMYNKFGNTDLMKYMTLGQYRGKQLLEATPFSINNIPRELYLKMYSALELKERGGLRQFSYEDARAMMFFDYYTQFLLMQGARSPEHLYTKRPFMPEMFGKTGAMINQSLIVDVWGGDKWHQDALGLSDSEYDSWLRENAGFIPRGALPADNADYKEGSTELVPAWSVESFPLDKAMENIHNRDFKGNVGNTIVAPSHKFIQWALDNPDIHMILAYHAAGGSPIMKALSGYDKATAMDDGYHTLGTDGKAIKTIDDKLTGVEISGGALQWNRLLRKNGYDAKKAAQTYLDFCKENGFTPMFNYEGVVDHPNYYKMLTDFRVYDEDGKSIRQKGVKAVLPDNWQEILNKYLEQEQTSSEQVSKVTLDENIMKEIDAATKFTSIELEERDSIMSLLQKIYGKGNVEVLGQNEFDVSLDGATSDGRAQMLRDMGGMVYGYAAGNRIVLNEYVFNANTPLHEHAHLYMKVLSAFNPRLYQRGMELWRDTPQWNDAKSDIERLGEEPTDDRVFSECMAQFTGTANEDVISKVTGVTDKNWIQKALEWMKEMWNGVKSAFKRWTKGDLDALTADDFAHLPLRAFYDTEERNAYIKNVKALNDAGGFDGSIRFSLKEEKEKIVTDAKANGTYMTAPNGEKTKLDAEQWATVRTANFKNWFGDWENDPENASKVVDENGEPMVVWHGRSAEFNTFEKKEGVRFIMGLEDKVKAEGFFFSPDKGLAEEFASNSSRHRGGKANVVPCFLNIRRPMDLTGEDYDRIYEDVTGWEYMVGMDTQDNLWGIMDEEGMADKIKEKGYDGAIFVEEVDDSYEPTKISYCALDANQIKSAENNNGDFSADNNDIRFSLKAMMEKPEGWKQANKKAIHIAEAIERDPKFSLKNLDGTLIKAGTYFSGGGLVEEGLKGIIDPVVAVEYDEKISGVYRNNFGQHIVTADVRDVDPKELVKQIDGEVEYFHASPVCKNYSQAKSNHSEVELDKETAASTAEFINAVKPKVVTIENVKGYKDSEAMKIITDALDANGYTWDADVYNAADYGGYTNRERLIVRAVRDGKLPAKPKKMAHKSGWYEAVADIIPTLTEKKNGVAPWMDIRLKADGIDWRNIDKPLYVMGSAYADGKVPHAFADELLPTLRTKSGDVIVMPDGKVYRAMGRVLARVSGVSDDYKMPFSENLSHTIIGNGIPTQLTEHVIAPLLTGSDPKFSIRTYHGTGASFDKFDLSHALEGEGSESFGHGVYVTNSSKIGREYAQRAKNRKMEDLYKNMRYPDGVKGDIFKRRVFGEMVNDVATGGSVASAKEFAKKRVGADANDILRTLENLKDREKGTEYEQNLKDRLAEYKEGLKWIDSLDEDYLTQGNANRYDVDIPDDNGSNYLDWEGTIPDSLDKQKVAEDAYKVLSDNQGFNDFKATPLNDFIAHTLKTYVNTTDVAGRVEKLKSDIKDVIENYVADEDVLALNEYLKDATPDDVLATIWYNDLVKDIKDADLGEELYRKLSTYVGDNAASQILSDNGLVGIKYPAGLIHGGAKEGDYNYVIFDENNANIVGNTRFSLRYDKFEHDLNQWKKDNNLPKDAQRPTIPQRNAGESAVDFLRRVDEYRKMMALWKTAPTYEQHLLSDDTALGEFNRELQRGSVLKRIAFQDSMLAIRKAQEAIMKEVGVDRLNMAEDAYTAENRSHGKGKNEFEEYNNEFLQPLRKAYHQMKKVLGDSYDNVRVYMMAKHGLERDAQMAFKKSLEADYEDVNQRSAAYKAYKNDLDRVSNDADLEFGRVDFTTWRQKDNALRGKYSPSYIDYRYDDNGIAYDYSGLSSLFDGSDFEEAAHKLVRDVETKHLAEVQALWNATNAATKKILRDGFKAGMMSKDAYEYVKGMYSHYIPLRGWDGTTADQVWDYIGGGKGAFNQTLKTAHGRTSIADDPIAYIENMAESGILLNNKNWVKQHLMLLAQNYPTSLLTLSKAWYVKSTDANGNEEWIPATPQITSQMNSNQVKAAIDAFEQKMEQMAQTGDATQQRDGLNIAYPQTHSEEREHEVRVMKDGEEYVIYVNGDPQLAQAMNNTRAHLVREIQSGKLDRAAAWLGRKMAAAYTSLSPLFIPSNYFRDLTMTLASTAIREDGRYNYLLRKNLATSWNLGFMLRDYQNGKLREKVSNGNATAKEQMFYDFMMNGGETGFVSSLDVEDLKKKFKNDLKDLDRWKANPVKVGHTIMDGIEFLNRAIEDSNRFAVYMTSIQYGRSIDEAVNDAKDVTLNFNRKGTGEYGWQMVRNLYLFINPAVQSLQTLGALAKHHPFKFTAVTASWLASGVLVPIVNAALMSLLGGDDDKDKYWQFTKWDRRNNLIMWVPFTHEYVKIPLAQEFRAFYGVGDMIASKMMGGELAEESWNQYAEDLLGQVVDMLPLDPTGYDGNIAVSLMPNAIRPVFELAFNVDFTGKPLFKDTEYNKYDPNFTKAYVGTPDWLVRVSKMVNSIGNDYPDVQQNAIDAFGDPRYNLNNPAVVDHVLSSYLGGAYTMGSQVLGVLTKSLNDPKEIKMADIPLVSKFVSNPDDRPVTKKQGDEFWNMKENHDRAANTLSKLKKQAKVDGDYSMLERFYGSEEYKQYKQEDVKVKKYEEDKKKERAEESGEEYRPHKLNAEDIYKAHATPKDDFEDLKLKQLYTKLNGFKSAYDLLVDTAPSQSDGYYNTNKAAIDAIDEISLDKQEISELKKGFLEDGKDAYNAEDMKRIRELRKRILSVLEPANKVVVANQKAKAEKK